MFKGATVFPVGEEENKFLCESKGQKGQVWNKSFGEARSSGAGVYK